MSPIIYGIWCILIIVLAILVVLVSIKRSREVEIYTIPSNWCYSDWMCGNFGAGTVSSPVLDIIPSMYACRLENFTEEGGNVCACPVHFETDYDVGANIGNTGDDRYQLVPTEEGKSKSELYICDNMFSGSGILGENVQNTITATGTKGGPCSKNVCASLWATSIFTDKQPGVPGSISEPPPNGSVWGLKDQVLGVSGSRSAPEPWIGTGTPLNPFPNMPKYKASTMLKQLKLN